MTKEARSPNDEPSALQPEDCVVCRLSLKRPATDALSSLAHLSFLRHLAFVIHYCSAGTFLFSAALSFAATNLPSEEPIPALHPARGEIAPTYWEQNGFWIITAGVILLGALAVAAWWLMRPKPPMIVPPDVQARSALESLRHKLEDGAVLSKVSQIMRHYVSAAFALPPGEMTTTDFCRAVSEQGRLGDELSCKLGDFLRSCDQRKFAPPSPVVAGIVPAEEGGILPPVAGPTFADVQPAAKPNPPGGKLGAKAGGTPAATRLGGATRSGAVAQALKLVELAEARRAQLPVAPDTAAPPQGPRAYRGAAKNPPNER
jgi:hypothetical protein